MAGEAVWRRVTACVGLAAVTCRVCVSVCLKVGNALGLCVLQPATLQPWMVIGLGMCMQSRGLSGSGAEGPMQDTVRDWIP